MWGVGVREFVIAAGTFIVLGGCQMVGPIAIDQGRDRYNNIPRGACQQTGQSKIPDPEDITTRAVVEWLWSNKLAAESPYIYKPWTASLDEYVRGNQRLGHLRRYILVIASDNPPANAYVAHFDHGQWYSIAGDDEISQKNFDLISLFVTMMAVPSATPPLSPTISVGGGG
jgi:hypothetical protein